MNAFSYTPTFWCQRYVNRARRRRKKTSTLRRVTEYPPVLNFRRLTVDDRACVRVKFKRARLAEDAIRNYEPTTGTKIITDRRSCVRRGG